MTPSRKGHEKGTTYSANVLELKQVRFGQRRVPMQDIIVIHVSTLKNILEIIVVH